MNAAVEVLGGDDGLAAIVEPWRRLAALRGNAFLSPDWYLAAHRELDVGAEPAVAVVRSAAGEVRGVLPLLADRRGLRFAGAAHADLVHPLAPTAAEDAEVAALAAPRLAERFGTRTGLDLGRVEAGADWWRALAAAWPGRRAVTVGPPEELPYARIAGQDWDEYMATRSGQFRNQVRRKTRALERDHEVALTTPTAAEEVPGFLATLFRLHDARWAARDDPTALAAPRSRRFLAEFAQAAHAQGWLRAYALEVDGRPVAAWLGWRLGERFSYYQAGFDPDWSRQSVGFLLLARTVERAIAEGSGEYDLLLGDEAFKARFATDSRHGCLVRIAAPLSAAHLGAAVGARGRRLVRGLPDPLAGRLRGARARLRGRG